MDGVNLWCWACELVFVAWLMFRVGLVVWAVWVCVGVGLEIGVYGVNDLDVRRGVG